MAKSYFSFDKKTSFGQVAAQAGSLFLNENKQLLVAGHSSITLWSLRKGEPLTKLNYDQPVTALAGSKFISVGLRNGRILIYSQKLEQNNDFEGHESSITCLIFAPDGLTLYSGSFDTSIIIWDIVGDCATKKLQGHRDSITGLTLNAGLLISCSRDKMVKIWDQSMCLQTLLCPAEVWGVQVFDEKIFAVSDKMLRAWSLENEELGVIERGDGKKSKGLAAVGDLLVCYSAERLEVWRKRGEKEVEKKLKRRRKRNRDQDVLLQFPDYYEKIVSFKTESKISAVSLSSNSQKSLTHEKQVKLAVSYSLNYLETYVLAYNARKVGKVVPSFAVQHCFKHPGHRTPARTLSLSENNRSLLSGSGDSVKIWDLASEKCVVSIDSGYCLCSAWFPGDKFVIIGCRDGTLQLFDVLSSSLAFSIPAHEGSIWSCDLKDQVLITGSADCSIKFWTLDLAKTQLHNFDTLTLKDEILAVQLTPNRKFLCAALLDCTIQVLYADSHKLLFSLYAHKLPVTCFAVTYDSTLLISGSSDKNLKVWGLDFGDCRKSIIAHSQGITDIKCVPETHFAFSAGRDFVIKYWDLDTKEVIQVLKAHTSEVWSICMSSQGDFIVTSGNDTSLILWVQSENQLFLKEQRELELEENAKLEDFGLVKNEKESTLLTHASSGALASAESLIEALEICTQYREHLAGGETSLPPPQFNNKDETAFILSTLSSVPSQYLDSVLYLIPYHYALELFRILEKVLDNGQEIELVARTINILLKVHENALISSTFGNQHWVQALFRVKDKLKSRTKDLRDTIGRNIAATKFILKSIIQ